MNNAEQQVIPVAEITSIAKGAGIFLMGSVIGIALKYIFELIVARSLGIELFGVYFFAFSSFKILERLANLGLNNGALRFVSLYIGKDDPSRIKGTIIFCLKIAFLGAIFFAIIVILFSHDFSNNFFPESNLPIVLSIFSLAIIFSGLTEIMVSSIQAAQIIKYKVLIRSIIEPGLSILVFTFFLIAGWRHLGAPLAFLISMIAGTYFSLIFVKKVFPYFHRKTQRSAVEAKKILNFSWPLFLVDLFDQANVHINTLILGYFKASNDVGVFGAIWRTAFIVPIVLLSFTNIFAPIISDLHNRKEIKKLEKLFKIVTKWIFTISFPISLLMMYYAKSILSLWGREYEIGFIGLILICLGQLINCITGPVGFMITMTGRSKLTLINSSLSTSLIVIFNILLIPAYGILGAAISLGGVIAIINALKLLEVYFILNMHPFKIGLLKPFSAGLISFAVSILGSTFVSADFPPILKMGFGVVLFLAAYIPLLFLFGFEEEDRLLLGIIKNKIQIT